MMFASSAGHVNCWNVANVFLYFAVVLVLVLANYDMLPWGEGSPRKVLWEKYPTLLTAGPTVLLIVPVTQLFNGVFVFWQLMPGWRNKPMVTLITPWWTATSLLQIQWIRELCESETTTGGLAYSMIIVLLMLACYLGMILVIDAQKPTFFEYWFLRAPFSFQAGWIIYCSAVNINIWAASGEQSFDVPSRMAIAMVSFSYIFLLTALFGISTRRPDPLIVLPVVWCMFWVWRTGDLEPAGFPQQMISAANIAAAHVYTGLGALFVMSLSIRLSMCCVSNKIPEHFEEGGLEEAGKSMIV